MTEHLSVTQRKLCVFFGLLRLHDKVQINHDPLDSLPLSLCLCLSLSLAQSLSLSLSLNIILEKLENFQLAFFYPRAFTIPKV